MGTLANLIVTNPIVGSVTGSSGSTSGNAATATLATTATTLATPRAINGTAFDGSAPITVTADASTLTGSTLNATVTGSSLTSVGTLANLTVTAPIVGSVNGNAATVTTNANLTGDVTSVGNATTLTNAAVITKVLTGYTAGAATVAATDNILEAIQKVDGNDALKAPLASPTFSGTPSLPTGTTGITQTALTSNTTLATTAYADAAAGAAVTGKQNTLTNSSGLAGALNDETGTGLAVFATNPILTTPNLGTPSTLVGTNITGTAAGLTAGKVTTNANLTGDVTSVGNSTTVGKINGTSLSSLSTGILKNTTSTGVPSIAVAGTDYLAPNATLTNIGSLSNSTGYLKNTGTGTFTYVGSITDADLSTIATAGKISNSATTATNANTASAIVARDAIGNFTAGTITGTLSGTATNVSGIVAIANGGTGSSSQNFVDLTTDQSIGGVKQFQKAATNANSFDAVSSATINFLESNIAVTTAGGASILYTLTNMKDGGAYTLVLTSSSNSGSATFAATGFTFTYMGTGVMISGKKHIYSFIVVGTDIYVTMATQN